MLTFVINLINIQSCSIETKLEWFCYKVWLFLNVNLKIQIRPLQPGLQPAASGLQDGSTDTTELPWPIKKLPEYDVILMQYTELQKIKNKWAEHEFELDYF